MLEELLDLRLRDVQAVTLPRLLQGDPELRKASPALAAAMFQGRDHIRDGLWGEPSQMEFATSLAEGMLRHVSSAFQFMDFKNADVAHLQEIYLLFADSLCSISSVNEPFLWTPSLNGVLRRHHRQLRNWVATELQSVDALKTVSRGATPTCGHYTPEFQLDILGIEPRSVSGPVLDLGCGENGLLVDFLGNWVTGEVTGIDQNAARTGLLRGSWFDAPLPEGYWSLIVAHQSFTLHLLHAHLHSEQNAVRYVRQYMVILRSLRIGGCFAYAPNLPFIEALLPPDQFEVSVKQVYPERVLTAPGPMRSLFSASGLGSTTVQRVS